MAKAKLTPGFVATAECTGKSKTDYWDTQTIGLVLECRVSGGKTYYFRYSDEYGKAKTIKIARFGDITLDRARKEAQRLRSEVTLGGDPAAKKAEKRAIPTYAELSEQHLAHAKTYQKSYDTTEMYMRRHIVPRWGKERLSEIKQQDVAKWLAEKAGEGLAPATVEKIRVIFGRSFELASRWNIPGGERNPLKGIPRRRVNNARDRYLTPAEAKRLHAAVAQSRNTQLPHIVGLLLLTGARSSELLNAKWEHIDLERKAWLIPTSKTGKARHVPLSQAAIDIIERVPRFDKCPYLLPNPKTLKPFDTIQHGWDKARKDAKLNGLRIHDLRHSCASLMINNGVDLFTVGKILGHADHQSTMRYSHLANDTLLAAVEAGAAKLNVGWADAQPN